MGLQLFVRTSNIKSSALKMETVYFPETLASTDESTRHQNSEEQHYHPHRRENLKSLISEFIKIRPAVLELKHVDARRDRQDLLYI
jgi:hypothetical protein